MKKQVSLTTSRGSGRKKSGRSFFRKAKSESSIISDEDSPRVSKQEKEVVNIPKPKLPPRLRSENVVGTTRWLTLKTLEYTDETGIHRKWDIASRTTKQKDVPDAVAIIPILKSKHGKDVETILVEQYRPPINSYSLEFPAGLVDENETPQAAALRELREETGFVGEIDETVPLDELCMSPGLCDETIQIVVVNVDMDDPRNFNPKQQLDDAEAITLKRVKLTTALKEILGESSSMPIALLYGFAIGLEMGVKYLK